MKKYILISILSVISCYSLPIPPELKYGDIVVTHVNNKYNTYRVVSVDKEFGTVTIYSCEYGILSIMSIKCFEKIVIKISKG